MGSTVIILGFSIAGANSGSLAVLTFITLSEVYKLRNYITAISCYLLEAPVIQRAHKAFSS